MSKKEQNERVAIINAEKCKPHKCRQECGLICPVNRQGKQCVTIIDIEDLGNKNKKIAKINEIACIGCGLCTKEPEHGGCPFGAIMIVNIPTEIGKNVIHRYGPNGFRLYKMPILRTGVVLGLIGPNGIGKTTIINILSKKLKPNFESTVNKTDQQIIQMFKGTEMQLYMKNLYSDKLKINIKTQLVDNLIPHLKSKKLDPIARDFLNKRSEYDQNDPWYQTVVNTLDISNYLESKVLTLSGGELQRLICAASLLSKSDVYIFDEPSNYLDVWQRLKMAELIKSLVGPNKYVIVIEHDLAILDYVSDEVSILYGCPNAYGVVSTPMGTSNAINSYFEGYIKSENMRFRTNEYSLAPVVIGKGEQNQQQMQLIHYPNDLIRYDNFELEIESGSFCSQGSITVIMGKNGTGKTTFVNNIIGKLKTQKTISYKPQYLFVEQFALNDQFAPNDKIATMTVYEFLINSIRQSFINDLFLSDVVRPLDIESIKDIKLSELSMGNLQKVWIIYCLGQNADIYLLDEPSAHLDVEVRQAVIKVLKKFVIHNNKAMFIVEHDMMINISIGLEQNAQTILVDVKAIENGVKKCIVKSPYQTFSQGINEFLKILGVTFHTQKKSSNGRPRINKLNSLLDREQKISGNYYD